MDALSAESQRALGLTQVKNQMDDDVDANGCLKLVWVVELRAKEGWISPRWYNANKD